uniref:hypothetical protein n=1 Tax=Nocardia sp. 107 TaxID=373212 RepID=UPI00186727BD|nr:hypothetical protein [Nocardia sp. 107]
MMRTHVKGPVSNVANRPYSIPQSAYGFSGQTSAHVSRASREAARLAAADTVTSVALANLGLRRWNLVPQRVRREKVNATVSEMDSAWLNSASSGNSHSATG